MRNFEISFDYIILHNYPIESIEIGNWNPKGRLKMLYKMQGTILFYFESFPEKFNERNQMPNSSMGLVQANLIFICILQSEL